MKVIVDLHAAPGSQNADEHSGTRDGSATWGDSKIDETVAVIDFLTQRSKPYPSQIYLSFIFMAIQSSNLNRSFSGMLTGVALQQWN